MLFWVFPVKLPPGECHKTPLILIRQQFRLWRQQAITRVNVDQIAIWRYYSHSYLTHWGRDEMNNISQTTFSNVYSSMKMFEFRSKFHWLKFVPKGPINNIPALVQIMAWRRSGDKPLSEPIMVSLPTHICVTRPQWIKNKARMNAFLIHFKQYLMNTSATFNTYGVNLFKGSKC